MLKTCSWCKKPVNLNHVCPNKPTYEKKESESRKFRATRDWTLKSIEIKQRDNFLCKMCRTGKYNTKRLYNVDNLEVHHIIPLNKDMSKKLDDNNLITLCRYHHNMAEHNLISRKELIDLIKEK